MLKITKKYGIIIIQGKMNILFFILLVNSHVSLYFPIHDHRKKTMVITGKLRHGKPTNFTMVKAFNILLKHGCTEIQARKRLSNYKITTFKECALLEF